VLGTDDLDELAGVVGELAPRGDHGALAVAAAVTDGVHRVHGDPVGGEPAGERVVQAQVLAVAVQQDDRAAGGAVGLPAVVEDPAPGADEHGHDDGPLS
jgi:hypothetical protein